MNNINDEDSFIVYIDNIDDIDNTDSDESIYDSISQSSYDSQTIYPMHDSSKMHYIDGPIYNYYKDSITHDYQYNTGFMKYYIIGCCVIFISLLAHMKY